MPNRETLETQIASVMEILAKTAVAEICKVVDSGCVEFRLEMCRRQKEIEALRKKVHCLTSERTSSREAGLGLVAPQRRTVGIQVDTEQGAAESQATASLASQDEPKGRAAPGLVVKVERGQKDKTQSTSQSSAEEFAVNFSVSEVDFPLWAPEMSGSGGPNSELGESSFSAPPHSPSQSDSSTEPLPGVRVEADLLFSPSPLEKPSCGLLPALTLTPIKMEHRSQCVSTSGSGKTETTTQDGHTAWHAHPAEVDSGKQTLAYLHSSQHGEQEPGAQGVGPGWGVGGTLEERLYLCSRCGQGFPSYRQLKAHSDEHAGEKDTKCGTTPVDGAIQRGSADKQLQCIEDEDWNSEVERKLQLELQRLQDSFSTQDAEHEDQRTHLTHPQESTSALTHTQEPVGFGELQLELKAEQEEEQVDQNLHRGACEYRTGDEGQMESEYRLGLPRDMSGSLKHPAWYSADSLKEGAAFPSPWSEGAGPGENPLHRRMLTERPGLSRRSIAPTVSQGLAPIPSRTREPAFSSGSCLVSTVPSLSHNFPSSSYSSSSSSLVHRHLLATATGSTTNVMPSLPSQRLFRCPSCPKSFGRSTDLERHQRIHTGERPFGCSVCGKRFSLRCNLVTHERVHSGSKPFACRHCGKRFAQASNMKAHQRIHTGERPFRCSLCSRSFTQLSSLKTHQRLHSRASQY